MHAQVRLFSLVSLMSVGLLADAPLPQKALPAPPPTTNAEVGRWDAGIAQRAEAMLASAAQWNRVDSGRCRPDATTFSIRCALQRAVDDGAGVDRTPSAATAGATPPPARNDCSFHRAEGGPQSLEGSCGPLFDEVPVFTVSHASAVTTGVWRTDLHPSEVWAGRMSDAEGPVMDEAEEVVDLVAGKKYDARLIDYNNAPTTTFADVHAFFRALEDRLVTHGTSDLADTYDDVEIEIYAGGTGVIRTYSGWFPVSGFTAQDSRLRFQIDTAEEVPANALDREILQHAAAIITSDAVWNRADNRKCAPTATTWSIYCAEERASIDVTGGFHHRRPALELVRQLVDERSQGKSYTHRLMDYNNDSSTHLEDVRSLFAEAIARIK
ncbi:MAG TPA: hypothetical protein VIX35_09800 [Vicinamibacterales bacterium]